MIGQKGIPAFSGGVERSVEEIATRLAAHGHEVFAYCRAPYTPKTLTTYRGVQLIHLPSIRTKNLEAITHTFFATIHALFRDVDVIHYHAIGPSSLLWMIRLFKPRTPVIATFHCQDYFHQKWGWFARMYLRIGELMACRFAHRTIVVSRTLKQHMWSTYQREGEYIPNGTNIPRARRAQRIRSYGLKKGNYILAVGRLVRHKGFHTLLEAYKQLRTTKKLVIVGGSSYTDAYVKELHRRAGDHPNILFLGAQHGEILDELYANAYCTVQPSEAEGMSLVLLEALSHGQTVLASNIPEHREVLEGVGLFFRNRSVGDLQAKLKFMIKHPEFITRNRARARTRVRRSYLWDDSTEHIERLYRDILGTRVATVAPATSDAIVRGS